MKKTKNEDDGDEVVDLDNVVDLLFLLLLAYLKTSTSTKNGAPYPWSRARLAPGTWTTRVVIMMLVWVLLSSC